MTKQFVVGLSGTHGTGKSTILHGVNEFDIRANEMSLSRAAQKMLGWDRLSIAGESIENTWALQNAILKSMFQRDNEIALSGKYALVDRTPADVWAYTAMWCDQHKIDVNTDKRAIDFRAECNRLMCRYATVILVPPIPEIPFVAESNRADLVSREFVQRAIEDFLWERETPLLVVSTPDITTRINIVVNFIKGLQ